MGKLRDLEIRYDHPSVYAGGMLTGSVCFHVKDTLKLKELSLWVEGQTKVTLPGDSSNERWLLRTELNLTPYLAQYDFRLPNGLHQAQFAFPVPPFLPSSFGEKYGYIYYCCRAMVAGVQRAHKPFTLIGVEDLNWHPYAALPVTVKESGCKSFWAFSRPTNNGSVHVVLSLERSGYIPGEDIEITAEIVNNSKKKLKNSVVQLRQGVLYKTAGGRTKETFRIVMECQRGAVNAGCIDQWEREPMTVPVVPPSFLRGSDSICLKYELLFSVPDAALNLVVPVIIGTLSYHPHNLRRIVKALPWRHDSEPIYESRRVPQQHQDAQNPSQPVLQNHQDGSRKHFLINDENAVPNFYTTQESDEDDEEDDENNNDFRATKYEQKIPYNQQQQQQQPQQQPSRQQPLYANKNNCYYYNEKQRFLRIEEID